MELTYRIIGMGAEAVLFFVIFAVLMIYTTRRKYKSIKTRRIEK